MPKSALIIGASRGLGYAMVEEYLKHGWTVTGTVRGEETKLHELAVTSKVTVETLDITSSEQTASLLSRLQGQQFDLLFVNSGTTNTDPTKIVAEETVEEFNRVMLTNALCPMRVIESLKTLVAPTGTIGIMSSGQGSVANNTMGMREVYRGTKAALNTFMRSFAARHRETQHPMVLMAPGWVKTELGGDDAKLTIEESVPKLVNVILGLEGQPGLQYLDYLGQTVPW